MTSTGRITAVVSANDRRRFSRERPRSAASATRALVLSQKDYREDFQGGSGHRRPYAPFVAHLVAMREQAPQFRRHRRAEPAYAAASYEATGEETPMLRPSVNRSV